MQRLKVGQFLPQDASGAVQSAFDRFEADFEFCGRLVAGMFPYVAEDQNLAVNRIQRRNGVSQIVPELDIQTSRGNRLGPIQRQCGTPTARQPITRVSNDLDQPSSKSSQGTQRSQLLEQNHQGFLHGVVNVVGTGATLHCKTPQVRLTAHQELFDREGISSSSSFD